MSAARNSSFKLKATVTLLYRYRDSSPRSQFQIDRREFFSSKFGYGGCLNRRGIRFINGGGSSNSGEAETRKADFDHMVKDIQPPAPPPPRPSRKSQISTWVKWLLGSVFSLLLPFWKQKWENLRQLEGRVEKVVGEVEQVVEVVEKVANVAEKVSAEVADQLPEKSVLKEAAVAVEHISNVTASDAQLAQDFIHKVEDVKQDLKDLETMVEPVIDNIIKVEIKPNKKY